MIDVWSLPATSAASRTAAAALMTALLAAAADARQVAPPRQTADMPSDVTAPIMPARRLAPAASSSPPPLPAGADGVRPVTLTLAIRKTATGRSAATIRQTVTRTADRVHVAAVGRGPEWLFERNSVDPRRVSGHFVDHKTRTIVFYSDSDLELMLGIPGWAHVVTLGCDNPPATTGTAPAPASSKVVSGFAFHRVPSAARGNAGAWWNTDQVLPAECTRTDADGTARLTLVSASPNVDTARLQPPTARFPSYRAIDLAEWLEGH
jgi:hypothetical protein